MKVQPNKIRLYFILISKLAIFILLVLFDLGYLYNSFLFVSMLLDFGIVY